MPDAFQDTGVLVNPDGTIATVYPRVIERVLLATTIANDATEKTLWQPQPLHPADYKNVIYEMQLEGDYVHNNVAADTIRFRVYRGGTALLDATLAFSAVINANLQPWKGRVRFTIPSPQWFSLAVEGMRPDAVVPAAGVGGQLLAGGASAALSPLYVARSTVLPTSGDFTVRVSVQWSAASPNNSFSIRVGSLVLY